jgi:hypothetical protein
MKSNEFSKLNQIKLLYHEFSGHVLCISAKLFQSNDTSKFQSKKKKTSEFFSHVSHLLELIDFTGDMAGPEQAQAGAA